MTEYLAQGRFRWDERKPARGSRQSLMNSISLPRTVPRDQSGAQRRLKKPGPLCGNLLLALGVDFTESHIASDL